MKKRLGMSILFLALLISCATESVLPETGSLSVTVTIGPLCPVEPCKLSVQDTKAIYETYSFSLIDITDKKVVYEKNISYDGTKGLIKAESLPVGEYDLDMKPKNIIVGRSFPRRVIIEKNKTTNLELNIDTGIR